MVTEALLAIVLSLSTWVVDSVPFPSFPVSVADATAGLDYLSDAFSVVGYWFPLGLVVVILTAYFAVHAAALLIRIGLKVLSYLTLGGGAV